MKKLNFLYLFLFLLIIASDIQAQSEWFQQYSGTDGYLKSVYFVNQNTGWAVGSDTVDNWRGIVLKTTNGGINWFIQLGLHWQYFNSVRFLDENTGCVAGRTDYNMGQSGIIFRTTNGGINWSNQFFQGWRSLYSIFFIDQNTGWAVGDYTAQYRSLVSKTTNGGIYWFFQISGEYDNMSLYSVYFVDQNTGWSVGCFLNDGSALMLHTTNGGNNWVRQNDTAYSGLHSAYFIDQYTGWAVGYRSWLGSAVILKTTDGGANWNNMDIIYHNFGLSSVFFMDHNTGFAAGGGTSGGIYKTTNGGIYWSSQYVNSGTNLNSIYFADQNSGWAVGDNGIILKTTNAGGPIGIKPISNKIPDEFQLYQNYPNPFNPVTKIKFEIPTPLSPPFNQMSHPARGRGDGAAGGFVQLIIYDILGREVSTLVNEQLKPGSYEVEFDGSNFASGIYFYRLIAGDFIQTKKMVLIK